MADSSIGIMVNGSERRVVPGTTLRTLIADLGLTGQPVAAEVNKAVVPFRRHAEHQLAEGDRVELVTLVGGG
jgi:sulfur carrier protein